MLLGKGPCTELERPRQEDGDKGAWQNRVDIPALPTLSFRPLSLSGHSGYGYTAQPGPLSSRLAARSVPTPGTGWSHLDGPALFPQHPQ